MSNYSQESWKSARVSDASDTSSVDGSKNMSPFNSRESRQITPRDRPFGKIPSPQHSSNSNESLQRAAANTSYESIGLGSYYSASNFSAASESDGQLPPPRGSDISDILQSMKQHNLHHVRTKDSPSYSLASSSDHSDAQSFPSDVSYETLDQFRMSLASGNSVSSQTAVSFKRFHESLCAKNSKPKQRSPFQDIEDELRRLKQEMKRLTMMYNMVCQESETARDNVHKLELFYKWRYYQNR